MKLGLVSLGDQANLEFERLFTTEFGVVAGEASTTLPGLYMVRVREIARGALEARLEAPPGPALDGPERSETGTQPHDQT